MTGHVILGILVLAGATASAADRSLAVPFFSQQQNGCGAASVVMVMHYWGSLTSKPTTYPTAEEAFQRLYQPERNGILLGDMKRYLEESGFRAFTFRGHLVDIEEHLGKGRPLIVTLKKRRTSPIHYVVVTGAAADYITLNDPTRKRTTQLKWGEFERQWNEADRWMLLAAPRQEIFAATANP